MATDLKGSVRRQIDRLRKELAVATGQVAVLQAEIKRHELVYDMLYGRKTGKRSRRGPSTVGSLKRGPRGALIDWTAVFATLPDHFTLDNMTAHTTASEKSRAYLRQVLVRWSKEGRIKRTGRGIYQKTQFRRNWTGPTEQRCRQYSGSTSRRTRARPHGRSHRDHRAHAHSLDQRSLSRHRAWHL